MGKDDKPRTHEVPNPDYERLQDLKRAVEGAEGTLKSSLKSASSAMDGGAWTGATQATSFGNELSGRSGEISGLVGDIMDAVQRKLDSTPKTITKTIPGS